jgi:hypothetical protein
MVVYGVLKYAGSAVRVRFGEFGRKGKSRDCERAFSRNYS